MWLCDSGGNLAWVDVATGGVARIGANAAGLTDIAFAPNGDLYGISFTSLYRVSRFNATVSKIGDHAIPMGNALTYGTDGTLYAASGDASQLYRVNPTTGVATALGYLGFRSAGDLAFHNGQLYMATTENRLIRINLAGGITVADVGSLGQTNVYGLATGPDGVLYAVAATRVLTVDPVTGAASYLLDYAASGLYGAYGTAFETEAQAAPAIVTQPSNQTVNAGAAANFAVTATGSLTLGYQWRREGTNLVNSGNISGVTTTNLLIANAQAGDAAGYSLLVTNAYGSVTSSVAQLTVVVPPNPGRFTRLSYSLEDGFSFIFRDGTVGQHYRIQVSPSLEGSWVDWQSFTYNGPAGFMDVGAAGAERRFYRAVSP